MIEKEKLKMYASKLMFEIKEEEIEKLQEDFDVMLKQMELIGRIPGIEEVEPMTFPFINTDCLLREDEVLDYLTVGEVLENAKFSVGDQIKVPRVVSSDEEV